MEARQGDGPGPNRTQRGIEPCHGFADSARIGPRQRRKADEDHRVHGSEPSAIQHCKHCIGHCLRADDNAFTLAYLETVQSRSRGPPFQRSATLLSALKACAAESSQSMPRAARSKSCAAADEHPSGSACRAEPAFAHRDLSGFLMSCDSARAGHPRGERLPLRCGRTSSSMNRMPRHRHRHRSGQSSDALPQLVCRECQIVDP